MPTPQRERLRAITPAEQAALQRIVGASSERVDEVRRATAILAVAHGRPFIHGARLAGLRSGTTVADLVMRFNRHGLAALDIAVGRGRKPTYVPSARAHIVATAQRSPNRRADGTATWSLSTLQRTLRRCKVPSTTGDAAARGVRGLKRSTPGSLGFDAPSVLGWPPFLGEQLLASAWQ
jgi:Helix-turn-helix domain